MSDAQAKFRTILDSVGVTVYSCPLDTADTLVVFGRLRPAAESDTNLKVAESRLLTFITGVLRISEENSAWKARLSRAWVLKDNKLAFTWDFTLKGDLSIALKALESVKVPGLTISEQVDVPIRKSKNRRGKVTTVSRGV